MRGIVLLSGGLDSVVNLAYARNTLDIRLCLTADYGQAAAASEITAARAVAGYYGLEHRVVELPFLQAISSSALFSPAQIPEPSLGELDDPEAAEKTARAVWVPNRNGLLINVAACFAEALQCQRIVVGFNREEAATFPDNSTDFVATANEALRFSTLAGVQVVCYTQRLDKTEIVALGKRLDVPWHYIWSCYRSGGRPCGKCESCRRLHRAMAEEGMEP
ncbi:7-cyano-7-deazaguanine synthase QueC [Desulforudis sp. 1088]|uniref:7-cyano-7-deazaguanine synthase QueC n=1 Tax=unclassified Candidatus Desulforudis TaxID=2635950 RepID=UPI003CE4B4DF